MSASTGRGRMVLSICLEDTPVGREGDVDVTIGLKGWYYPATYYDPEDSGVEPTSIEFDKGLTEDEEDILKEWIEDNFDDLYDPDKAVWADDRDI